MMQVVNDTGKKVIQSVSYYCNRCGNEKNGKRAQCSQCLTFVSEVAYYRGNNIFQKQCQHIRSFDTHKMRSEVAI